MLDLIRAIKRRRDDRGASAVEYGLLVAAIAAIIVAIVFAIGAFVQDSFENTCNEIATASSEEAAADCTPPAG